MEALASDRLRLRCLRAYRAALSQIGKPPALGRLARQIRRRQAAAFASHRRHIREIAQLPVPVGDQQFVPMYAGRWLLVRSFHDRLGGMLPDWLTTRRDNDLATPSTRNGVEMRLHAFGNARFGARIG